MREEPVVFEITGKYDDSTHLYSDLKILMDSQEQESQLIHLVIPSRPAQPSGAPKSPYVRPSSIGWRGDYLTAAAAEAM